MKSLLCKLPVGDLLEGRQRRDREAQVDRLKEEAYARLVEARRARAREAERRVRAYLSLSSSSGRQTTITVTHTASTLTSDSCMPPSVLSFQTPSTGMEGSRTCRK